MTNNELLRRGVLALCLNLACVAAVADADTAGEASETEATAIEHRFGVFYDDKRIGEHTYAIIRDGNVTRVRSRAEFEVKLLFVTVYRYRHQANELWRDGCLTGLASETDDNGQRYAIDAQRREARLQLTRLKPAQEDVRMDSDCPASFAYWDRERLERDALINAQTGEITRGRLIREGEETIDGEETVRYRLEAGDLATITLWYRSSDDAWVRLETRRNDARLQYRLEASTQRQVSGIDEDARVEDPPGV